MMNASTASGGRILKDTIWVSEAPHKTLYYNLIVEASGADRDLFLGFLRQKGYDTNVLRSEEGPDGIYLSIDARGPSSHTFDMELLAPTMRRQGQVSIRKATNLDFELLPEYANFLRSLPEEPAQQEQPPSPPAGAAAAQ